MSQELFNFLSSIDNWEEEIDGLNKAGFNFTCNVGRAN